MVSIDNVPFLYSHCSFLLDILNFFTHTKNQVNFISFDATISLFPIIDLNIIPTHFIYLSL